MPIYCVPVAKVIPLPVEEDLTHFQLDTGRIHKKLSPADFWI